LEIGNLRPNNRNFRLFALCAAALTVFILAVANIDKIAVIFKKTARVAVRAKSRLASINAQTERVAKLAKLADRALGFFRKGKTGKEDAKLLEYRFFEP
jgi:hypothetical protein